MATIALTPETAPVPIALYECSKEGCGEQQTYEPDMLRWWAGTMDNPAGWYCDGCLSYICQVTRLELYQEDEDDQDILDLVEGMRGPTLYEELARRRDALTVTC